MYAIPEQEVTFVAEVLQMGRHFNPIRIKGKFLLLLSLKYFVNFLESTKVKQVPYIRSHGWVIFEQFLMMSVSPFK